MSVGPLWPQTFVFPWVFSSAPEAVPQGSQCLGEWAPKSRGREKAARFPPDCPLLHGSSSSSSTFTTIWFQLGFKQEPWDEGHGREEAFACLAAWNLPGSCLCVLVVDEFTGSPKSRGVGAKETESRWAERWIEWPVISPNPAAHLGKRVSCKSWSF